MAALSSAFKGNGFNAQKISTPPHSINLIRLKKKKAKPLL